MADSKTEACRDENMKNELQKEAKRNRRLVAKKAKYPEMSLRKLARIFHISHERVRKILERETKKEGS